MRIVNADATPTMASDRYQTHASAHRWCILCHPVDGTSGVPIRPRCRHPTSAEAELRSTLESLKASGIGGSIALIDFRAFKTLLGDRWRSLTACCYPSYVPIPVGFAATKVGIVVPGKAGRIRRARDRPHRRSPNRSFPPSARIECENPGVRWTARSRRGWPNKEIDGMQSVAIDDRGNRSVDQIIKPAADQRISMLKKIGHLRSEV